MLQPCRRRTAVERICADRHAFLQIPGAADTISVGAAFSRATSRKGLGVPSSTPCSATRWHGHGALSASPPTRVRRLSSGVTFQRCGLLPFSECRDEGRAGEGDFHRGRRSRAPPKTDSAPRFFSTCASGCTHCREKYADHLPF